MTTTTNPTTNPNKALWEKGDFTQIAATMRSSGEDLVRRIGVAPGLAVLDLGCGDGTTAIPAAQAGANVRGVDIAANLVAAGQARAEQLGLTNCTFEEGDASNLDGTRRRLLRPRRHRLRCHVRPAAVRHRRRDGARRQARRSHRDGQLDPR